MGHESVVYGTILGSRWCISDRECLQRINRDVIARLPEDDDWPFLTRAMFALSGTQVQTGTYKSQPIFFGATFKEVEWVWDEWLAKFEALLLQLYWDEVYLHLRTELTVGHYDYLYQAEKPESYYTAQVPMPIQAWTFSGGPRHCDFQGDLSADEINQFWRFHNGIWSRESMPE